MSNDDPPPASNHSQNLTTLLSDTERTAVRSLLYNVRDVPAVNQCEELDTIFTVVSHPARRYVLTYLLRAEGYVTMAEIVDYVIEATDVTSDPETLRREVTMSLTHTHLPMLENEGFVQYNMERQLIHPTEKTETAAPYLKVALLHCEEDSSSDD